MSQEKDCLFCKIGQGEIPSEIVFEDKDVMAFKDIDPQAPHHIVIIPKDHYKNVKEAKENQEILGKLLATAAKVSEDIGLDNGFRIVINTGEEGGQTVDHLHLHLLGGRNMQWPPG